jgi:hemerythrin-like metal-binding protein
MRWKANYSVGVDEFDKDHKSLMHALNKLHAAALKGKSNEIAGKMLRRMVVTASGHFAAEEKAMESAGFPGLAEHRAKHHDLSAKLAEFLSRDKNADQTMYVAFLYFVRDWFKDHMLNVDREYAPLLKNHGIK